MQPELKWSGKVGAIHHARWMSPGIAAFKIILCGEDRFQMGQMQAKGMIDLAFFMICIYGQYWFAAPVAADAAFLTLSLWKDLHSWASRDPALSASTLRTLDRHTWYVCGRNISLPLVPRSSWWNEEEDRGCHAFTGEWTGRNPPQKAGSSANSSGQFTWRFCDSRNMVPFSSKSKNELLFVFSFLLLARNSIRGYVCPSVGL